MRQIPPALSNRAPAQNKTMSPRIFSGHCKPSSISMAHAGARLDARKPCSFPCKNALKAKGLAHGEPDLFSTVEALKQVRPSTSGDHPAVRLASRLAAGGCKRLRLQPEPVSKPGETLWPDISGVLISSLRCSRRPPHRHRHCRETGLLPRPPAGQAGRPSAGPAAGRAARPACGRPWRARPWRS